MKIFIILGGLLLVGAIAVGVFLWGNVFMYTEGISETQVNTYTEAIEKTNDLQEKVNVRNQDAADKLQQIQNSAPKTY